MDGLPPHTWNFAGAPFTWKLAGNAVTMVAPDYKQTFVAQIVSGTLQWAQPFDVGENIVLRADRRGKPLDTAERPVAQNPPAP